MTRRAWLAAGARWTGLGIGLALIGSGLLGGSAAAAVAKPQPEEKIADTIKRLFGERTIQDGASFLKLDTPLIAENGSVVPVKVSSAAPQTKDRHVKNIYILVDKNRRPMSSSFSFAPEAGRPFIGTNLRLGGTSQVRAVAEMNDGSLFQVAREVKVTVGGCGG